MTSLSPACSMTYGARLGDVRTEVDARRADGAGADLREQRRRDRRPEQWTGREERAEFLEADGGFDRAAADAAAINRHEHAEGADVGQRLPGVRRGGLALTSGDRGDVEVLPAQRADRVPQRPLLVAEAEVHLVSVPRR